MIISYIENRLFKRELYAKAKTILHMWAMEECPEQYECGTINMGVQPIGSSVEERIEKLFYYENSLNSKFIKSQKVIFGDVTTAAYRLIAFCAYWYSCNNIPSYYRNEDGSHNYEYDPYGRIFRKALDHYRASSYRFSNEDYVELIRQYELTPLYESDWNKVKALLT